ncbi:hypothetical protein ACI65C_000509 [Semiaphis heraclei]
MINGLVGVGRSPVCSDGERNIEEKKQKTSRCNNFPSRKPEEFTHTSAGGAGANGRRAREGVSTVDDGVGDDYDDDDNDAAAASRQPSRAPGAAAVNTRPSALRYSPLRHRSSVAA